MKKILSMILLVAAMSATAPAMDWGLKAGPSFSRFRFSERLDQGWRSLSSFQIGAFLGVRLFGNVVLRPEILFSRLGGEFTSNYAGTDIRLRERLDYLVLPVLVKFEIPLSSDAAIRVCGGGYTAALIGAKTVMNYRGETFKEDIRREIHTFDYGYCLGMEVDWKNYILELRYNRGLSDIKKYHQRTYEISLSGWALLLGYRF
jgi:hypothetical protein